MRALLIGWLLVACAGSRQQQLAETPTARSPRSPSLAPPASGSEKERYQLNQQFQDMRDTQQAHEEADQSATPPPAAPTPTGTSPGATPAKKRGPAIQGPPVKKRAPAVEAPKPQPPK